MTGSPFASRTLPVTDTGFTGCFTERMMLSERMSYVTSLPAIIRFRASRSGAASTSMLVIRSVFTSAPVTNR